MFTIELSKPTISSLLLFRILDFAGFGMVLPSQLKFKGSNALSAGRVVALDGDFDFFAHEDQVLFQRDLRL